MSRRLRAGERAKDVAPLSEIQQSFIYVHLARGASPAEVRRTMNRLAQMSEEKIRLEIRPPPFRQEGSQPRRSWTQLAGQREVSQVDVRRAYDRLRKSPGTFNEERTDALAAFENIDNRNAALAPYTGVRYASARTLHDLGFARRFGASQSDLENIADGADIPRYLTE